MRLSTLFIGVLVALAGCRQGETYVPTGPLARVLVDSAGGVHLNNRPITISALRDSLRVLQAAGGAVLYSRKPPDGEPNAIQSPVVEQVLQTITSVNLPVRLIHPDSLMLPDSVLRK